MFQVLKKYTIKLTESRASVVFQFKSASANPTYCQNETREGTALRNSETTESNAPHHSQTIKVYFTALHHAAALHGLLRCSTTKEALFCITVRKQEALFPIQYSAISLEKTQLYITLHHRKHCSAP